MSFELQRDALQQSSDFNNLRVELRMEIINLVDKLNLQNNEFERVIEKSQVASIGVVVSDSKLNLRFYFGEYAFCSSEAY